MTDQSAKSWFVYMLLSGDQTLYTGITTDLERRLKEHQSGKKGAKYLRGRDVQGFVYTEGGHSRSSASAREAQIKKLTRRQKLLLIAD